MVSLAREDAQALLAAPLDWSKAARWSLRHIAENHPLIAGLRHDVSWSMELGIGAGFDGQSHDLGGGRKVIRAPLSVFDHRRKTSCCALLGENRTDADLFVELGLMMLAARRWERLDVCHEPRGGGWNTTAVEFQGMAHQGRVVLAIADTDKRHPQGGEGDTYRNLVDAAATRPAYQRARPLHVRTAEALIPLSVYREVLTSPERRTSVDRIAQLLRSAPADLLRYAPLKDGIRLHQVENPRTPQEGEYWSNVAANAGRDRCNRPARDQCTKREQCSCYVVDVLGADALSDVVTWMKAQRSKRRLADRFGLSHDPALSVLADEVLAWGLALAPVQT